jgi:hypothetical protein
MITMRPATALFFTFIAFATSCKESANETSTQPVHVNFADSANTSETTAIDSHDSLKIIYSYVAGQCIGYCNTVIAIHSWGIVKTETGTPTSGMLAKYPTRVNTWPVDSADYAALISSFDTSFFSLPETIGCPDCNDGGWAELQISSGNRTRSVSFPVGISVPEIEAFLKNVKSITSE